MLATDGIEAMSAELAVVERGGLERGKYAR